MSIAYPDMARPVPHAPDPGGRLVPLRRFAAAAGLGAVVVVGLGFGLKAQGWLPVGAALGVYVAAVVLVGWVMARSYPHRALGLCNLVTLLRLALTSALVAPLVSGSGAQWGVLMVAAVALALDGVDGWLARRQHLVSHFGARFDMEVDAGLGLVLAVSAFAAGSAGAAVLALGMPRYVFAAAGRVLPWLGAPLPDRIGRKWVCVIQIGVLIGLQVPGLPVPLANAAIAVAAAALCWSFGRDILWLWRRRA
ncbi:Phosphatidylglycerophosphate synthase [Roseovarius litoreus]|uniref:Phosphatidylglycerophosphate synthase n=1 Tax=Roseovarius litoreus TaxID=1155722 RepID=A0A1M7C5X4_9RHOB|nr:CDP-alcohol phosphatidyltransferase family protein [Roseovarius litoreus]SHL62536.1 Phosphatidylglycerophosphate synthase [Roseovarius litoreus]